MQIKIQKYIYIYNQGFITRGGRKKSKYTRNNNNNKHNPSKKEQIKNNT